MSPTPRVSSASGLVGWVLAGVIALSGCAGLATEPEPSLTQLPVTQAPTAAPSPSYTQTLTASPTQTAVAAGCELLTQEDAATLTGAQVGANQADPAVLGKVAHGSGKIIKSCVYKSDNVRLSYNVQEMSGSAAAHVTEQKRAIYQVANPTGTSFPVSLGEAAMGVYSTAGAKPLTRVDVAQGKQLFVVTVVGSDQTWQQDVALKAAALLLERASA